MRIPSCLKHLLRLIYNIYVTFIWPVGQFGPEICIQSVYTDTSVLKTSKPRLLICKRWGFQGYLSMGCILHICEKSEILVHLMNNSYTNRPCVIPSVCNIYKY